MKNYGITLTRGNYATSGQLQFGFEDRSTKTGGSRPGKVRLGPGP